MRKADPKVSVIVTAHNYGKYLPQCLDSVITQRYENWELVIVNDGSTDNSLEVIEYYKKRFNDKIQVESLEGVGLAKACNSGIMHSRGQYIIRLDADDYFDENILLVESNILDSDPNIHMVYPDYYRISKHGEILESVRLSKINDEVKLLDRSPLAAGAMYRRECYDKIGGYNEALRYQEDYDFWIRFIDKFNVYNVNLPLLYYRKHDSSMSTNSTARMESRRLVKKKIVEEKGYRKDKKVIAVIPVIRNFRSFGNLAMKDLADSPLIYYTIHEALRSEEIDRVFVSTEDQEIADYSKEIGAEIPFIRPLTLAHVNVPIEKVLRHLLEFLEQHESYKPDIVVQLSFNSPFRKASHISEAVNSLLLFDANTVIDVVTDLSFHWKPGINGLKMVGFDKRLLREDKETVYKEGGSIYAASTETLYKKQSMLGERISSIELTRQEVWRVEDEFSYLVANMMMVGLKSKQ